MASFNTNVDHSENRATNMNVIGWFFTGVAIATVSLKLFARIGSKRFGWDDFFIFLSMALSIIAMALVSYSATLGLGRHTATVVAEYGIERYEKSAYWQIIGFPFNIGAFSFPNISIAILIVQLLDPNPLRANLLYAMVIFQVILAMIYVFIVFFQCKPTEKMWNSSIEGTCWSSDIFNGFSYLVSAYTTMTDIVLAIVPISAFWKLQMPFSTRLSVCIMMGLTLLSAVVTIIKATYLNLFTDHTDPLFKVVPLVLWGVIEQNVVIVAACIPTLRPLFRKAFESTTGSSGEATSQRETRCGFKLAYSSIQSLSKRTLSVTELPLKDRQQSYDIESSSSQFGIWRTREVMVESDDDRSFERGVGRTDNSFRGLSQEPSPLS
ncbi:hypothetical protein DTO013E5_2728 [Penicillium roqueforti]|uniref:uncharacterized protein n=1 Tax=Penicillium roqueforti TaxID=5082 RepID=UPI0019092C53|nr:uncharacterized protein LCP9604111_4610 [Penicillium roqueforti]KAF9249454.1 hypothetical protein LCP9604111_4610 [Penicillium roqueforti]KAI1834035.1 hypothetical protein CBS147337_4999 [Penicillium roqueforti]KAI2674825.1 hypothetical protein CBS147355_6639 [Penicillium roqueforti]KAI2687967.1 hypothetical protein LCP963914a_3485 [Penicillium roqueforti]KAI2699906.1 hypothetical protein CBS147372_6216 [Penicillium roqueforti]